MTKHTTFTMHADDRSSWYIKTNDYVMIKRLDKIGASYLSTDDNGTSFYILPAKQVTLRNPSKLTEEQRQAKAEQMRALRARQQEGDG